MSVKVRHYEPDFERMVMISLDLSAVISFFSALYRL